MSRICSFFHCESHSRDLRYVFMFPAEAVLHEWPFFRDFPLTQEKSSDCLPKNSVTEEIIIFWSYIFCTFAVFENFVFPLEIWFPWEPHWCCFVSDKISTRNLRRLEDIRFLFNPNSTRFQRQFMVEILLVTFRFFSTEIRPDFDFGIWSKIGQFMKIFSIGFRPFDVGIRSKSVWSIFWPDFDQISTSIANPRKILYWISTGFQLWPSENHLRWEIFRLDFGVCGRSNFRPDFDVENWSKSGLNLVDLDGDILTLVLMSKSGLLSTQFRFRFMVEINVILRVTKFRPEIDEEI